MEILVVLISLFTACLLLALTVQIYKIPVVGDALDFFAEVLSGPRFIYLAWPFLFSSNYRNKLIREHRNRVKWLAWIEYLMALIVFVFVCAFLYLVIHHNITRLLLDGRTF